MTSPGYAVHATSNWLNDLDPRVKVWFVLLGMFLIVVSRDLTPLALLLLVVHLVLLAGVSQHSNQCPVARTAATDFVHSDPPTSRDAG
jgi:hypothetical protein